MKPLFTSLFQFIEGGVGTREAEVPGEGIFNPGVVRHGVKHYISA